VAVRFDSLYRHGFARVAVGVPLLQVADPAFNAERTLGGRSTLKWPHCSSLIWPHPG